MEKENVGEMVKEKKAIIVQSNCPLWEKGD